LNLFALRFRVIVPIAGEVTMSVLRRAFSLGLLLALVHASPLSADPVLVSDTRRVTALSLIGSDFPPPDVQMPAAPFAPFVGLASSSVTVGEASAQTTTNQRSSFGDRVFRGSGSVDSSAIGSGESAAPAFTAGSSLIDVDFDLTSPHRFDLLVQLAVSRMEEFPGSGGFGEADFVLSSDDVAIVADGLRFGSRQREAAGILPAGSYRLYAEAFTESVSSVLFTSHTPTFDLELSLTPVPEPGSLLLLGGGCAALAARRRSKATLR
jgi:hypothetical protein